MTGWRSELAETSSSSIKASAKLSPEAKWPLYLYQLRANWLEGWFIKKDQGVAGDKLNLSQQCHTTLKKAKCILGCISRSTASRSSGENWRREWGMFKPRKRTLMGDYTVVFQLSDGKVQRRQSQTLQRGVQ